MDPNGPFSQMPPEKMREYMSTEYFMLAGRQGSQKDQDILGEL
jgi:hypothetical protein